MRCVPCIASIFVLGASALAQVQGSPQNILRGVVRNAANGAPVGRSLVRVGDHAALTDREGRFAFDLRKDETGSLQLAKPGFYSATDLFDNGERIVKASAEGKSLELLLYPEALLTGTLAQENGEPLPHLTVRALRSLSNEQGHLWNNTAETTTDDAGNFRLPVPPGDYKVEPLYAPIEGRPAYGLVPLPQTAGSDPVHVHSGEERRFDLRAAVLKTYPVEIVIDPAQEGFSAQVEARSATGIELRLNPSRGEGDALKVNLPSGQWLLSLLSLIGSGPRGPLYAQAHAVVDGRSVTNVVFHGVPMPAIAIKLTVDPESIPGDDAPPGVGALGLMLHAEHPMQQPGATTFRPLKLSGMADAFYVPPGSYRIAAQTGGPWYVQQASYGVSDLLAHPLLIATGAGDQPIQIVIDNRTGKLSGTTKLQGSPASCWVYLVPAMPAANPLLRVRSDAEGIYRFEHLPPGTYRAVAFEDRRYGQEDGAAAIDAYATSVHTANVQVGVQAKLDLDAVPSREETVP